MAALASVASKKSRWLRLAALVGLGAAVFAACSSDTAAPAAPPVPPTSPSVRGALACDGLLTVELSLSNWLLRPPGTCYGIPNCGSVRLSVIFGDGTPAYVVNGSAASFIVDLRAYGQSTLQSLLNRPDALAAQFVDDYGSAFGVTDASAVVGAVLPCNDAGNPEAGAAGAAGGEAGANAGGMGGSDADAGPAAGGTGGADGGDTDAGAGAAGV